MKKLREKQLSKETLSDKIVLKQEHWRHKDFDSKPEKLKECIEEQELPEDGQTQSTELSLQLKLMQEDNKCLKKCNKLN